VQYHALPALLLNELQRQERKIEEQGAAIEALRAELNSLKQRN
jgi:hypothetical protein